MKKNYVVTSFKVNPSIRDYFKIACIKKNKDMSSVLESLMLSYIRESGVFSDEKDYQSY